MSGGHIYTLEQDDAGVMKRWACSCGEYGGTQDRSPGWIYNAWVRHVERATLDGPVVLAFTAGSPDAAPRCDRAPRGWWCSRPGGHTGPCAARPRWWWRPLRLLAAPVRALKRAALHDLIP